VLVIRGLVQQFETELRAGWLLLVAERFHDKTVFRIGGGYFFGLAKPRIRCSRSSTAQLSC